jgi:hypothetical protein
MAVKGNCGHIHYMYIAISFELVSAVFRPFNFDSLTGIRASVAGMCVLYNILNGENC